MDIIRNSTRLLCIRKLSHNVYNPLNDTIEEMVDFKVGNIYVAGRQTVIDEFGEEWRINKLPLEVILQHFLPIDNINSISDYMFISNKLREYKLMYNRKTRRLING